MGPIILSAEPLVGLKLRGGNGRPLAGTPFSRTPRGFEAHLVLDRLPNEPFSRTPRGFEARLASDTVDDAELFQPNPSWV